MNEFQFFLESSPSRTNVGMMMIGKKSNHVQDFGYNKSVRKSAEDLVIEREYGISCREYNAYNELLAICFHVLVNIC